MQSPCAPYVEHKSWLVCVMRNVRTIARNNSSNGRRKTFKLNSICEERKINFLYMVYNVPETDKGEYDKAQKYSKLKIEY